MWQAWRGFAARKRRAPRRDVPWANPATRKSPSLSFLAWQRPCRLQAFLACTRIAALSLDILLGFDLRRGDPRILTALSSFVMLETKQGGRSDASLHRWIFATRGFDHASRCETHSAGFPCRWPSHNALRFQRTAIVDEKDRSQVTNLLLGWVAPHGWQG